MTTTDEQLAAIDERIGDLHYRSSIHKDECAEMFAEIPVDWTPYREYHTRTEVVDILLDARSSLTEERTNDEPEETNDGELQEELDALLGADLNTG